VLFYSILPTAVLVFCFVLMRKQVQRDVHRVGFELSSSSCSSGENVIHKIRVWLCPEVRAMPTLGLEHEIIHIMRR
jgi:hypothetical protein